MVEQVGAAAQLPSYRTLLDRQGQTGLDETALVGDEDAVADGLRAFAAAGATDVLVGIIGDAEEQSRTLELVSTLRRAG